MDYIKDAPSIRQGSHSHEDDKGPNESSLMPIFGRIIYEVTEDVLNNEVTLDWSNGSLGPTENVTTIPTDSGYVPYIERPETYIVPILFFIIFVIGVLGNGTLILIFLRHKSMRNVPNM